MGHEVIVWGMIEGARYMIDRYRLLQELNAAVIENMEPGEADRWPFLNRSWFALPGAVPYGTYRDQIIHFGGSIKDEPGNVEVWDEWLAKFEAILRKIYWYRARVVIEWESGPPEIYEWAVTDDARKEMLADPPTPVSDWERTTLEFQRSET